MLSIDSSMKRTWAEVDLDAVAHNYTYIRNLISPGVRLCCVVKANAYGHGAVAISRLYEQMGADMLAVSSISEALHVRRGGVRLPILVLGYTEPGCADRLAAHNISQCVYSEEYATALLAEARRCGVQLRVHVKLDTGMGRIGFCYRDGKKNELDAIPALFADGTLIPEGIFTHFAVADDGEAGKDFTMEQLRLFSEAVARLEEKGLSFAIRHCANSAAALSYPESHLDMVRVGLALYGYAATPTELIPAMTLKTVVAHGKDLAAGESVSYGRKYFATHTTRVLTLPVGYADGYRRCDGGVYVTVYHEGKPTHLPVIGRICMDQLMVNADEAPFCRVGDEVTLFGADGAMSAAALAELCHTIPYEILIGVGNRVPRMYLKGGQVVSVVDGLS